MKRLVAASVAVVVLLSLVPAPGAGAGGAPAATAAASHPCVGTVTEEPDAPTLLSIQGARGGSKTAAMAVGIRPNGSVIGVHNASANGRWWAYDVDPLPNGNLLLSTTEPGISVVEAIDPTTGEHVWTRRFPDVLDSHDADLSGDELLLNDMSQDGDDRVLIYNLTREAVVWEYRFADHPDRFPESGGGEFGGDWTHNNDVEWIGNGTVMVSVRNFDQVVAIDRSTKRIEWTLGSDDDRSVLYEQHNPDFFVDRTGTPTALVADSLNDRVVEYARTDDGWTRTWTVTGLEEPRDADRLPNGHTLVADRRGHRLVELSPEGEVLWEFFAPWQPYDAERIGTGDESTPPSMRAANAAGTYELSGSSATTARIEACYDRLTAVDSERLLSEPPPGEPTGTENGVGAGTGAGTGTGAENGGGTDRPIDPDRSVGTTSSSGPLFPTPLYAALVALLAVVALRGLRRT